MILRLVVPAAAAIQHSAIHHEYEVPAPARYLFTLLDQYHVILFQNSAMLQSDSMLFSSLFYCPKVFPRPTDVCAFVSRGEPFLRSGRMYAPMGLWLVV